MNFEIKFLLSCFIEFWYILLFHKHWQISERKHVEVQVDRTPVVFVFSVYVDTGKYGHPGVMVQAGLLGFSGNIHYYEYRHGNVGVGELTTSSTGGCGS